MYVLFVCRVNGADFIPNNSYDTHGVFSSPRALFMFRSFGHHRSSVLNGGLPAWEAHGFPLESGKHSRGEKGSYPPPKLNEGVIRGEHRCLTDTGYLSPVNSDYEAMVYNSSLNPLKESPAEIVIDARARGR